jgi:hypothetical protein
MNFSIKGDIFTLVVENAFTQKDFFDTCREGMHDAGFKAPMRALVDARKAEQGLALDKNDTPDDAYAQLRHCFIPHWAIVAASDQILFDVARMICACSDFRGVDMRAYGSIEEARSRLTWANIKQQDPFCRIQTADCRPHFIPRPHPESE